MVVDGNVDGLGELFGTEFHQLAGGERRGRQAEDRTVPTARVEVESIEHPAIDLIGQHDCGNELDPARPLRLRNREASRDNVARMPDLAPRIDVVQVEVADGRTIGEGGEIRRGASVGADDRRDAARGAHRDLAADADGLLVESCDQARDRIDEMRLDGLDRRRVDVGMTQPVGVGGKPFRKRTGS
jgi:hypothetical protein